MWQHHPTPAPALNQPGAGIVRSYLDGVLRDKRRTHQVCIYCRGEGAGIDSVIRAYSEMRKFGYP